MTPVSIPTDPAPPKLAAYGAASLQTVKTFTRESYEAAFGVQAPPCNPALREKAWFDSTLAGRDPEDQVTYQIIGQDKAGTPVFRMVAMSVEEASSVNLPGKVHHPAYVVQPTKAVVVDPQGVPTPISPDYLSLRDQAFALCQELGVDTHTMHEDSYDGPYKYIWPDNEPRRNHVFGEGETENAGMLLKLKNAYGVGAPGYWVHDGASHKWVATAEPSTPAAGPVCPVPVRSLLPTEKLIAGFGGTPEIVNAAALEAKEQAAGGFTEADRALLAGIGARLAAIASKLEV